MCWAFDQRSINEPHRASGEQARINKEIDYGGLVGLIGFVRVVCK